MAEGESEIVVLSKEDMDKETGKYKLVCADRIISV